NRYQQNNHETQKSALSFGGAGKCFSVPRRCTAIAVKGICILPKRSTHAVEVKAGVTPHIFPCSPHEIPVSIPYSVWNSIGLRVLADGGCPLLIFRRSSCVERFSYVVGNAPYPVHPLLPH